MSEYRIDKIPVPATITMADGKQLSGNFYKRTGSVPDLDEDVRDILNAQERFFPFLVEADGGPHDEVHLVNRASVVTVRLGDPRVEGALAESVGLTPRKFAMLTLSTGESISGVFRVAMPSGRDRISDYANAEEQFCYLEGPEGVILVNLDHVTDILTFAGAAGAED